jgi:hypothetical protein
MFPFIFLERIRSIHEQTDVSEVVHRAKEDEQAAGDAPAKVHKGNGCAIRLGNTVGYQQRAYRNQAPYQS